jgi:integrase
MITPSTAWNTGRLLGQKPPLKPKEIWSIRIHLQLANKTRDLALFNLALDSKLRGCDLINLKVRDVCQGGTVASRAIVMQRKTQRPVQFEITEPAREAIATWMSRAELRGGGYLFPGRKKEAHLSLRQYARLVKGWVACVGLDPARYGTHSLRRTKCGQRTFVLFSCFLVMPSSKALCDTSGSRLTTLWRSPSRSRFRLLSTRSSRSERENARPPKRTRGSQRAL